MHWNRAAVHRRQSDDGGASVSSECEMRDDSSTTTLSQRSALKGKRRAGLTVQRQRGKRTLSSCSREINPDDDNHLENSVQEGPPVKRTKKG